MSSPLPGKAGSTETFLDGLLRFSPDAVIVTDRRGKILQANEQTERLFGYNRDELVGQPVEILVPDRFRSTHAK
ncbi:MAG: PAS domain S-box protein, partial [Acidobacteriota bacterium]|nr:PAS domain S-box protein [Acidobacteriota bacterium]